MKYTKFVMIVLAAAALSMAGCSDDDDDEGPAATPDKPALGMMMDRTGRPAVTTALIGTFNPDDDSKGMLKDNYNTASPSDWASFAPQIASSLGVLDSLDANCGNQPGAGEEVEAGRYDVLAGALASDVLLVRSTDTQCGYLGLETEVLGLADPGTAGCGGRLPTDDVVDISYHTLSGTAFGGDGVDSDDGNASNSGFPYFGAP